MTAHKFNGELPLIEKGIPIPEAIPHNKGFSQVLSQLEVGDSVLLPVKLNLAAAAARRVFRTKGWTYTSRKVGTGTRIWRLT